MEENKKGRPKKTLTREEITEAISKTRYFYQAAELLGVSYPTFLREKERLGIKTKFMNNTTLNKKLELVDYGCLEEFMDTMEETDRYCVRTIGYDDVYISIEERCIIMPWGDWHIGNIHTQHSKLASDLEMIKNYSNVYVVLIGDYADNFNRSSRGSGVYEQVITVPEQKQRVEYMVKTLKEKILGICLGCHDKWMFENDAFDFAQYLAKKCNGSWLGFNGLLHVKVGDVNYDIYATHKCERWSRDNPSHGLKDIYRTKAKFDVGFAAHRHVPSIEYYWIGDKWIVTIRTGSYKMTDYFLDHKNLPKYGSYLPCVILDDKEKEILAFPDLKEAVKYL